MNKKTKELFEWIWETSPKDLHQQLDRYEKTIKLETY